MGGNIQQGLPITLQAAMGGGSTPPTQGAINAASQQAAGIVPGTPQWLQRMRVAGTALSEATGSDKLGG